MVGFDRLSTWEFRFSATDQADGSDFFDFRLFSQTVPVPWVIDLFVSARIRVFCFACLFIGLVSVVLYGCDSDGEKKRATQSSNKPVAEPTPEPLDLLIIDEPNIADAIQRQWAAQTGGELKIQLATSKELSSQDFKLASEIDVIVYPVGLLGELDSQEQIVEFSRKVWQSESFNQQELLSIYQSTLPRHDNLNKGVALGSPMFSLLCGADVDQKSMAPICSDWGKLIEYVRKNREGNSKKESGESKSFTFKVPLAQEWAVQTFLARSAPMVRNRGKLSTVFDRSTMKPLIDSPPFLMALRDLKELADSDPRQLDLTPQQIFDQVLQGQVSMGIGFPAPAKTDSEDGPESSDGGPTIRFRRLPGGNSWYDNQTGKWIQRDGVEATQFDLLGFSGLMGSVTKNARSIDDSSRFLAWLANKSTVLKTFSTSQKTGPFRKSHLGNPKIWIGSAVSDESASDYAAMIEAINQQGVFFLFPRIPGRQEYLQVLDEHVRACLQDEMTPEEALSKVAAEWEKITERLGARKMKKQLAKDSKL